VKAIARPATGRMRVYVLGMIELLCRGFSEGRATVITMRSTEIWRDVRGL
jgi:hypothetical protein